MTSETDNKGIRLSTANYDALYGEVMEQSVSVGGAQVELMNVRTYRKPRFMPLQPLYECQNCGEIVESVSLGPWMIGWCADCFDEEWPEEEEK